MTDQARTAAQRAWQGPEDGPAPPGADNGALSARAAAAVRDPDDAAAPDIGDTAAPEPGDAVWSEADDDRTREALRWLRVKRREHRRQKGRDLAVAVYGVLLIAVGYGSGYAFHFVRQVHLGADYSEAGEAVQHALPAAFALVTVATALLAARDALWRGPVVVPGPTVGWLLAQPVRRAAVLRPWLWLSVGLAVLPALFLACVAATFLHITGVAALGAALLALLPAAVCLPALTVALAMAVERRPGWAGRVRRYTPGAVVLLMLLVTQTVLAARGHRSAVLEWCELWSGPWGWAAQPVVHACGGAAPAWWTAPALLLAATAAALAQAHRDAARLPNAELRRRAATVSAVTAGLWTMDPRVAKLAVVRATGGGTALRGLRLRPPRRRAAIVWRDALALLRAPGLLGKALAWLICASATAGAADALGGRARLFLLAVALLLGYMGVAALAETARLETDDVRRSAWSPVRLRHLMLQHAVVPATVGALLAALVAAPYAMAGTLWPLLLMPLCAPPLAAAAVYGACRGPSRTDLLFTGVTTPVGDPGPLLYAFWYVAGPLTAAGSLAFVLDGALSHGPGAGTAVRVAAVLIALTAGLLFRAARSADRLVRNA
ncbi:hypothetical protein ACQUSR_30975 [Streptomyces sp. P1-3]|uniref:hypothetical protein n=1 Tax=Streptomyces sp. P1-3 TaxID=3421658 RepID=UPI003D35E63B